MRGRRVATIRASYGRALLSWQSASPTSGGATTSERAADRIEPYAAAAPYGVAVAALTTWARTLVARIEQDGGEVPEDQLAPRLIAPVTDLGNPVRVVKSI